MRVSDFDYELPVELIAQKAVEPRDGARLMVLDRAKRTIEHRIFRDLPEYLRGGDVLVVNDTKVMPWKVVGQRASGGKISGLLIGREEGGTWRAMLNGRGRLKVGERVKLFEGKLEAELVEKREAGEWRVRFTTAGAERIIEEEGRAHA